MPVSDPTGTSVVELSRAEQWVVHHVLLDALGLAGGDQGAPVAPNVDEDRSLAAIRKLEAGSTRFSVRELSLIREACGEHAAVTEAAADRNLATAVAERIDEVLGEASA